MSDLQPQHPILCGVLPPQIQQIAPKGLFYIDKNKKGVYTVGSAPYTFNNQTRRNQGRYHMNISEFLGFAGYVLVVLVISFVVSEFFRELDRLKIIAESLNDNTPQETEENNDRW
ncbi:hypothetical protein KJ641_00670 [Patescibacteria group bacterium]|nr:hypothetical protein [Patescibacteria group bacterium]MBU1895372.1 hypothetical protein [Patescibacteria group bacterium]